MRTAIVLVVAFLLTGCAHAQPGAWTCSASSVLAVIDSIASGEPSPAVDDAASCWLDLWREQPKRESAGAQTGEVDALAEALKSGDGVAEALAAADAALPGVCRPE